MTFENVRDIIVSTLSCDAEEVKLETNLVEDLEADSLEIVELSMALQESLGVGIEDEDLEKIHTVQDILDYIKGKQA
ncbi:MAG: acyl carrier protein [Lawsonibacter sp.]|uniref:acyl carrier protein n=1 Tax=Lawsonibacter sp. JLR.KK007 TaxID=3114293 RepID=UPI0021732AFF|nr:acyl carrier protein [Lawsonibacter sp.]MCI8989370.1 acyl carrier protein [Lawsonibacter sp.]MCI9268277.1 acyl carrier protein [Lawsonibacter sp.]